MTLNSTVFICISVLILVWFLLCKVNSFDQRFWNNLPNWLLLFKIDLDFAQTESRPSEWNYRQHALLNNKGVESGIELTFNVPFNKRFFNFIDDLKRYKRGYKSFTIENLSVKRSLLQLITLHLNIKYHVTLCWKWMDRGFFMLHCSLVHIIIRFEELTLFFLLIWYIFYT